MSESQDQPTSTHGSEVNLIGRLPRSLRGYDRAATDALLKELTAKQAELEGECTSLREQVAQLESDLAHHRAQEQLVAKTLIAATSHATVIKEDARREAEEILSKAREEFDRRAERAERAERERVQAEHQLLRMRRLAQEMQNGLAGFLTRALDQLRPQEERATPEALQSIGNGAAGSLETELEQEVAEHRPQGEDVEALRPSS